MPKESVFATYTSQTTVSVAQLEALVAFLVRSPGLVLPPQDAQTLLTARALMATPINTLYSRALEMNKDKLLALIRVPVHTPAPEVITFRHVSFDMRQLAPVNAGLYRALAPSPFADRIVLNVTPWMNASGTPSDLLAFQGAVVRDLITRSYFLSDRVWVSPANAIFLTKVYTMTVVSALSGVFGLSQPEAQMVAVAFALFYLERCSDAPGAEAILRTSWREFNVPMPPMLDSVIATLKGAVGEKRAEAGSAYTTGTTALATLDDVCTAVQALGIPRLIGLNRRVLVNTRLLNLGPSTWESVMALDYPPYLAWLILYSLSGRKMGLSFTMQQHSLVSPARRWVEQIALSGSGMMAGAA